MGLKQKIMDHLDLTTTTTTTTTTAITKKKKTVRQRSASPSPQGLAVEIPQRTYGETFSPNILIRDTSPPPTNGTIIPEGKITQKPRTMD